jgi:UDP-glucose:(heptosyl)LPS alpha-1,3-glucosyltransferase
MIVVPPTLSPTRRHPELRTGDGRQKMRSLLGIEPNSWLWLSIGVQPKTKGIDRTIEALNRYPNAQLIIVGLNQTDRASQSLAEHSRNLGVASRVKWLGHREDIPHVMSAADLLLHPARYDTTGTVILEAIVNGLPVITTAACGYAPHVEAADAGLVVREPFDFSLFVAALARAQEPSIQHGWSVSGIKYGNDAMLYRGRQRAAEIIMEVGQDLCKQGSRDTKLVHFHNLIAKRNEH